MQWDIVIILYLQRPDLWTTEELGKAKGDWMSENDMAKLRKMYQCEEGKQQFGNKMPHKVDRQKKNNVVEKSNQLLQNM